MTKHPIQSTPTLWARFRFSVVGSLLSSPPARGELKAAIESLAAKTWTHPVSGRDVRFAAKTIECWFYRARQLIVILILQHPHRWSTACRC